MTVSSPGSPEGQMVPVAVYGSGAQMGWGVARQHVVHAQELQWGRMHCSCGSGPGRGRWLQLGMT